MSDGLHQPLTDTPGPGHRSGRRRRRSVIWSLGGLAVLLASLVVAGLVVLNDSPDVSIKTDEAEMELTRTRLRQVEERLDGVAISSDPTEPPKLTGCTTDSGDLFQPRATVGWKPAATNQEATLREVAAALTADGWEVSDEKRGGDQKISLTSPEGWTASGFIYSYLLLPAEPPYVGVEVQIDDARPCST